MSFCSAEAALDGMLANKLVFESSDVSEVRSKIGTYFKPHSMRFLDTHSQQLRTSLRRARLNSLSINLLEYGGNVLIDPGKLEDFYLIHVNLAGECEIAHEGGHMTISKGRAAVCTPHRPYRFWWQPKSCVLAIQIPRVRLLNHLRDITGVIPRTEIDFDFVLNLDATATKSFSGLLQFLLNDADDPHGLSSAPATAEALERTFLTALLSKHAGSHQEAMAVANGNPVPAYVAKAEQFMKANLQRPIRLDELADITNVTERTLNSSFRRFRGDTPARYFLAMRLQEARKRLRSGKVGQTVSDIAFDLGFHHLSSFAASYRARYDECPSTTLRCACEQ